jgi:hypothetical protein
MAQATIPLLAGLISSGDLIDAFVERDLSQSDLSNSLGNIRAAVISARGSLRRLKGRGRRIATFEPLPPIPDPQGARLSYQAM